MSVSDISSKSIWCDIENAPHAWVLLPIAEELQRRGVRVLWTAKDSGYIRSLCSRLGIQPKFVGPSRAFASNIGKIAVVLARALALTLFVVRSKARPSLGVSHGSRSATLAAWFLRISSVTLDDYEYSYQGFARFASSILVPSAIPPVEWGNNSRKVRGYPGFKEMIYLAGRDLSNTSGFLSAEDRKKVVVVFRPDSPVAHYWSERSESFRRKILDHLAASGGIILFAFPRTHAQAKEIAEFCREHKIDCRIPIEAVDGPALIAQSDLVIGGGGTMTREAAVLGIPSFTFFSAKQGAVDSELERLGLLVVLRNDADIEKISLKKRKTNVREIPSDTKTFVVSSITDILQGKTLR